MYKSPDLCPDPCLVALHSQHSLQSGDLLLIQELLQKSSPEGSAWTCHQTFHQLLGWMVHSLATTPSQDVRHQLAQQLPKFGSAVVGPMVRLLCRMPLESPLHPLVMICLEHMEGYPLVIGLDDLLSEDATFDVRTLAMQLLLEQLGRCDRTFFKVLPKLVSQRTWQILKLQLLMDSAQYPHLKLTAGQIELQKL